MRPAYPFLVVLFALAGTGGAAAPAGKADLQPLAAQAIRIAETLDALGAPLSPEDRRALTAAPAAADESAAVASIRRILDRYCLLLVHINPESRVKAAPGAAKPELGGRLAHVPGPGEERGRRHGGAEGRQPQRARAWPTRRGRRSRTAGWRSCPYTGQPMQAEAVRAGRGIPHLLALQPRSRASARRRSPSTWGRARRTWASAARSTSSSLPARRATCTLHVRDENGKPTHGDVRHPGRGGARLSLAGQAAGARTSRSIRRSIAPTARRSSCPPGEYTVEVHARARNTCRRRGRCTSRPAGRRRSSVPS